MPNIKTFVEQFSADKSESQTNVANPQIKLLDFNSIFHIICSFKPIANVDKFDGYKCNVATIYGCRVPLKYMYPSRIVETHLAER